MNNPIIYIIPTIVVCTLIAYLRVPAGVFAKEAIIGLNIVFGLGLGVVLWALLKQVI